MIILQVYHHIRCNSLVIYSPWAHLTLDFCSFLLVLFGEVTIFGRESKVFPHATLRLIQWQQFTTFATRISTTPATNTITGIIIINRLGIIAQRRRNGKQLINSHVSQKQSRACILIIQNTLSLLR